MGTLGHLEPTRVFYYFEELAKIPCCSGDEEAVSQYLEETAKSLGREVTRDHFNNVVIRKPASIGYEDSPVVVLQGHMDMVCEKLEESAHNFAVDPISLKIDDDFISAEDTTLGADDGIGIALALAILEDESLKHPPLEFLFTAEEETGMSGAIGLDTSSIRGRRLLNLDSENEGELLVGCAGGETLIARIPIEREGFFNKPCYVVEIKNLKGGHSGLEINEVRGNAVKIMIDALRHLKERLSLSVCYAEGGTKHNAIPRSASATICFHDVGAEEFVAEFRTVKNELKETHLKKEPDIEFAIKKVESKECHPLSKKSEELLVSLLSLLPHGVHTMMENSDLVESSNNLAKLEIEENCIVVTVSIRSANEKKLEELSGNIREILKMLGANIETEGEYPPWQYREDSSLRGKIREVYRKMYGEPMKVNMVHAGLECGIFAKKFPGIDMVSMGPNVYGVHTPAERLSISSTKRTYEFLVEILANLKE